MGQWRLGLRGVLGLGIMVHMGCASCEEDAPSASDDMAGVSPDMTMDASPEVDMTRLPADMTPDGGGLPVDMPVDMAACDEAIPGSCGEGELCVQGMCVMATCEALMCGPTERCEPGAAGGFECVGNTCTTSADCPEARFCNAGGVCLEDVCVPATTSCSPSNSLRVCATDGSGVDLSVSCPLDCEEDAVTQQASCTCRDDWECPTSMRCEAGVCLGSGRAAECTLDPVPFAEAQPTLEMSWGTRLIPELPSPYPEFSNVAMTTIVANLDDDNLDGVINEFDFPEILFVGGPVTTPFNSSVPAYTGVLRVLRGGGPDKGATAMAVCGDQVWREGDSVDGLDCDVTTGKHFRVFGSIAVADMDGDGSPEIATMIRDFSDDDAGVVVVRVLSAAGDVLVDSAPVDTNDGVVGQVALNILDVDGDGMAEVLVGAHMFSFTVDDQGAWTQHDAFSPEGGKLRVACAGDFASTPGQEWFDGLVMWRKPVQPADRATRADCDGSETDDALNWCTNQLSVVWDQRDTIRTTGDATRQFSGLCAVADVWAGDAAPTSAAELDGKAEVVLIGEEELVILDAETGALLLRQDLNPLMDGEPRSLSNGGAPNIDDFDGDGMPEIGSAFSRRYIVADLQPTTDTCVAWESGTRAAPSEACTPGSCGDGEFCDASGASPVCRCLNNSWVKTTEDDSSRRTGSSVFDFNGDGAAEVVYNDECFFRIYDGRDGSALFEQPSEHITNIEYPVVADVDNDGNAEIIFSSTSQGVRCSIRGDIDPATGQPYSSAYNTGVQVWGDANDAWVSARRIWNQHAYSVTNVYEDGRIPTQPVAHWRPTTQGLLYNTFRSNPRSEGLAPDLVVTDVRLSSPMMGCGVLTTQLTITGRVENRGDLRVGPGVAVLVSGEWSDGRRKILRDAQGDPLVFVNAQSIEPLRSVRFELSYDAELDGETEPPETLFLEVDPDPALLAGSGLVVQSERECREDNNITEVPVEQDALPDLKLVSVASDVGGCPLLGASVLVRNEGSAPVSGVDVSFYAGSPDLGGKLLGTAQLQMALAPGEEATIIADLDLDVVNLLGLFLNIYAVVKPSGGEDECNLSNNVLAEPVEVFCPEG